MARTRRTFLRTVSLSTIAATVGLPDAAAFSGAELNEGILTHEGDQETYLIGRRQAPVTFLLDRSRGDVSASLCREEIVPNDGIPVHKHLNEDELIYIQYGSGIFTLGEKEHQVKEGSAVFVPRGIWHGLTNNGTANLRMVFSFTPAGFENYFREIGVRKGSVMTGPIDFPGINKKYGIVYR